MNSKMILKIDEVLIDVWVALDTQKDALRILGWVDICEDGFAGVCKCLQWFAGLCDGSGMQGFARVAGVCWWQGLQGCARVCRALALLLIPSIHWYDFIFPLKLIHLYFIWSVSNYSIDFQWFGIFDKFLLPISVVGVVLRLFWCLRVQIKDFFGSIFVVSFPRCFLTFLCRFWCGFGFEF